MTELKVTKTTLIWLIASLMVGAGGWVTALPEWSFAGSPGALGGLIMIIGSILAAWIGKSPLGKE